MGFGDDQSPLCEVIDSPATLTAMQNCETVQDTAISPVGPFLWFVVQPFPLNVRI